MDAPASPPKRITRSRATVKTSTATAGTASSTARKTATVATKTKTTRTVAGPASSSSTVAPSATRTSTKRKTRPDDHEDDSEAEAPAKLQPASSGTAPRATRGPGRPRKIVDPKPNSAPTPAPAAARPTRGRPPKKPATEPVKEEALVKSTRTRAKRAKVDHGDDADDLAPEPVKRPRGRPVGSTKSAKAPASKTVRKTVTFAEPDKENVLPLTGSKAKTPATKATDTTAAGMRAKPVRKPITTSRPTKSTATKKSTKENTEETEDKPPMPLSPRKVTQHLLKRDQDVDSEDELAMDRTPARPFHRSPMKPPVIMKPPVDTREESPVSDEVTTSLPLTEPTEPTEPTVILGSPVRRPPPSPFKGSLKSPAKRIEGLQIAFPAVKEPSRPGASPSKASLMHSPAKRCPVPIKPVDLGLSTRQDQDNSSPFKQSLFQSPARRLFPPTKSQKLAEPEPQSDPELETIAQSPAPTPALLPSPVRGLLAEESEEAEADDAASKPAMEDEADGSDDAANAVQFDEQVSAVLSPEADPALGQNTSLVDQSTVEEDDRDTIILEDEHEHEHEQNKSLVDQPIVEEENRDTAVPQDEHEHMNAIEDGGDPMTVDAPETEAGTEAENTVTGSISTTPPNSPPQQALDMFGLRQEDIISVDESYTESEHELTRVMTPKSVSPMKHMKGSVMKPRTSGFGFTPLAQQFDSWQTRSPLKSEAKATPPKAESSAGSGEAAAAPQDTPMKNAIFDDEMASWPDAAANDSGDEAGAFAGIPEIKDPICEDISLTDEDFELVAEANEMSVMSPEQVESMLDPDGNDDTISEASQEYGDENEMPANNAHDNTLVPPVTPQRRTTREFHTVSKIPLKAADESTPPPQPSLKKRRHSISRIPETRPTRGLTRSATVISYSPSHKRHVEPAFEEAVEEEDSRSRAGSVPPVTPTKAENWTNVATPIQSPRREVDPGLLRGAVVFVDVHTMEGADASAIFVELLTQMGARCVKSWYWNPNEDDASSKIGITHVVYKDGGKRTMEKVRETGGVVQCVGVGWVLDCERENEWLDEAPYYIDTSLVPRGGARRRKSMEPKTLANNNGTLVSESTTRKASARESQTAAPSTPAPANRRDSTLWMQSPDDYDEGDDEGQDIDQEISYEQHDWFNSAPLTPVPKTPAPEAIRRFAMELTPDMDSPMTEDDDEEEEELSREQLVQRTCPPKAQHMYENLGAGVLGRNKDESVARRLMDARRKSLAFAPKVSSPLAKSWKEWN